MTRQDLNITDSEWEVMRVVWTIKKASSKDIIEVLEKKMNWKPPTTKTFIGRLVKKGMLSTETEGRRYLYTATVQEDETVQNATSSLFEHVCSKEVGKTIANMIAEATLSHEDVKLLQKTIEKKKSEAVDEVKCNCVPGQCNCKSHNHGSCEQ
ncbi:CopY/TcrY family copper transport repressor [Bacillaceae bacterium S4-13-58]